jgi:MFS family permease
VFILAGLVSASVTGALLDKYKSYVKFFRCACLFTFLFAACMLWTIRINFTFMLINIALVGASTVPVVPVGYALGVELTYPINPTLSNGFMISIGMVWAVIMTLAGGPFATYSSFWCMFSLVVLALVSAVFSFFVKEELRRTNATSAGAKLILEEFTANKITKLQTSEDVMSDDHLVIE